MSRRAKSLRYAILALSLASLPGLGGSLSAAGAPRMARAVEPPFGLAAEIEVLGTASEEVDVDRVMADAFDEIRAVEEAAHATVTDRLSVESNATPVAVAPHLLKILVRAQGFCEWSEGAAGPLAGGVYNLWDGAVARPRSEQLRSAVQASGCDRLQLDSNAATVQVLAGSRIDLRDFAPGYAIDRAVDLLKARQVTNARVRIGDTQRAFGPGRNGRGWEIEMPAFATLQEPLDPVVLQDDAISISGLRPLTQIAGDRYASYFDLRTGAPAQGVVGVITVTPLAIDAAGLSNTLFITGNHEGEMRLGVLRPTPSVLWLLGSTEGAPLIGSYHWSRIRRR